MAIVNIQSYTGRLYQFDDVLQKFIMNPNSDAGLLSLTGWNNTPLSIGELSALHNGTTLFTGRPDYSGDPQKFPIMVLASGGIITNSTQLKVRVDRDPDLSYAGVTTFDEATIGTSTDLTIDLYFGQEYATTFQYTANFTSGDYKVYTFSDISYTDPDTGRSATLPPLDITFNEFPSQLPWESKNITSWDLLYSGANTAPYVDVPELGYELSHVVGPAYVGDPSIPVGDRQVSYYTNYGLVGNLNNANQMGHIVYPRGSKPVLSRTKSTLVGSGAGNMIDFGGKFTVILQTAMIGPQDGTEHAALKAQGEINFFEHFVYGEDSGTTVIDFQAYTDNTFNPSSLEFKIIKGDDTLEYCNKPTGAINGKIVYLTYENLGATAEVNIWYKTMEDDGGGAITALSTTTITNPSTRVLTSDLMLNGNNSSTNGVIGTTLFTFIDDFVLDYNECTTTEAWTTDYQKYVGSMFALGDSWTGTYPTVGGSPKYDSYSNVIIEERVNAGGTLYDFGIFQNYLQDYVGKDSSYSLPVTSVDSWPDQTGGGWANDWPIPASTDPQHRDFSVLVDRIAPISCLLAYTGINYNELVSPPKATNPAYGNKTYSEPIEACKEHIKVLDSKGIDYRTVNSAPTAGEQDLIDRAQDATYSWSSFFPDKTYDLYSVVNDGGNNGNILPSYQENVAHLNLTGTNAVGQDMYAEFVGNIVPIP